MKKEFIYSVSVILVLITSATAQFGIKIPKIKKPEIKNVEVSSNPVETSPSNRQMVMDDGYTFFDAEPVEEYDSKLRLQQDIGWYLRSDLRMLGTFPRRSAFKIVVKQNGKSVSEIRCEGLNYQKATDSSLSTAMLKKGKDLNFEDFMYTQRCYDEEAAIKPTGKFDVEILLVDGDTDEETFVRKYMIDVHRATRVRGSTSNPQPDVSHYYIQRHAESSVAFIHVTGNHTGADRNGRTSYFRNDPGTSSTPGYGQLVAYFSISPDRSPKSVRSPFARCSVDGRRIALPNDRVSLGSSTHSNEYAIYTDRIAPEFKRGSAYRDDVRFLIYSAALPLYSGEGEYSKPPMKIEDSPGNWECQIISNGQPIRTFRFTVGGNGEIEQHAEQAGGNVNLFYKTYLVDMEIPPDGAPFDFRLIPQPEAGLFYGVPWSSQDGKAMAGRLPRKGNAFHVPSNKAK